MARFAPVEYYRDVYGCTATLYQSEFDGMWYMTVADAHGNPVPCNDPYLSHKGARIALGKMSDGTMKLVPQKGGADA